MSLGDLVYRRLPFACRGFASPFSISPATNSSGMSVDKAQAYLGHDVQSDVGLDEDESLFTAASVDADALAAAAIVLHALDTRPGRPLDWRNLISLVQGRHGRLLVRLRGVHPGHGTLLHRAIDCRKPEYCALLIMRGADISALDSLRATPLIRCASRMCSPELDLQVASVLLHYGACVDDTDPMGRSALHHAAAVGNAPLVELLAARGAKVNRIGGLHRTALHTAAMGGHLEAIKLLVCFGADVTITDELNGMTALDVAVKFRRWEVATFLKEKAGCARGARAAVH